LCSGFYENPERFYENPERFYENPERFYDLNRKAGGLLLRLGEHGYRPGNEKALNRRRLEELAQTVGQ
jgi:hypothetical protein